MATKNIRNNRSPTAHSAARPKETDLNARYGRIGISAVAAAARYSRKPDRKAQASSSTNKRGKVRAEVAEN